MKREQSHRILATYKGICNKEHFFSYLFLQYSCDLSVPFLTNSHIYNRQLPPRYPCLYFYYLRCMFTIPCYLRLPVLSHSLRCIFTIPCILSAVGVQFLATFGYLPSLILSAVGLQFLATFGYLPSLMLSTVGLQFLATFGYLSSLILSAVDLQFLAFSPL
jgi:hypothetical protein